MTSHEQAEVFEYALVRVVPRVERGEAINAGVIVYAQTFRYLCARIELDESRLLALDPAVDLGAVRAGLSAFERACTEGPLAGRPLGERFRWLTAPRSTIVQPGPVHSGLRRPGCRADPPLRHLGPRPSLVSLLWPRTLTRRVQPRANSRAGVKRDGMTPSS